MPVCRSFITQLHQVTYFNTTCLIIVKLISKHVHMLPNFVRKKNQSMALLHSNRRRRVTICTFILCNTNDKRILKGINTDDPRFRVRNANGYNSFQNQVSRAVQMHGPILTMVRIPFFNSKKYLRRIRPFGRDVVIRNYKNMKPIRNNAVNYSFKRCRNRSKRMAHLKRSIGLVQRAIHKHNNL